VSGEKKRFAKIMIKTRRGRINTTLHSGKIIKNPGQERLSNVLRKKIPDRADKTPPTSDTKAFTCRERVISFQENDGVFQVYTIKERGGRGQQPEKKKIEKKKKNSGWVLKKADSEGKKLQSGGGKKPEEKGFKSIKRPAGELEQFLIFWRKKKSKPQKSQREIDRSILKSTGNHLDGKCTRDHADKRKEGNSGL